MNRFMQGILLGAAVFCTPAFAKFHSAKEGAKVFLLEARGEPAQVVPLKILKETEAVMMRMPDLGASGVSTSAAPSEGKSARDGHKKLHATDSHSAPIEEPTAVAGDKPAAKPLKFSKAKIKGTLRLPRVKFARVGVPLDIRDEIPSLDFTSKSLKDGDF